MRAELIGPQSACRDERQTYEDFEAGRLLYLNRESGYNSFYRPPIGIGTTPSVYDGTRRRAPDDWDGVLNETAVASCTKPHHRFAPLCSEQPQPDRGERQSSGEAQEQFIKGRCRWSKRPRDLLRRG